jgi:6-phosphogluconate dehydrogenase
MYRNQSARALRAAIRGPTMGNRGFGMEKRMQIGMVGLGRMGANMARRMARAGAQVSAFDLSPMARSALAREGGITRMRNWPRWSPLFRHPASYGSCCRRVTSQSRPLRTLATLMAKGDVLVDGGNANYKDSRRRAGWLAERGLGFVDAGVSGGVWGLENGYALMLGGRQGRRLQGRTLRKITRSGSGSRLDSLRTGGVRTLRQDDPQRYRIRHDAGVCRRPFHHASQNGIRSRSGRHHRNVASRQRGALVVTGSDGRFLKKGQTLESIDPVVADSGEGRWTAIEAIELGVPAPVMSLALMARFASQGQDDYAARLLAMMRAGFGGHAVQPAERGNTTAEAVQPVKADNRPNRSNANDGRVDGRIRRGQNHDRPDSGRTHRLAPFTMPTNSLRRKHRENAQWHRARRCDRWPWLDRMHAMLVEKQGAR